MPLVVMCGRPCTGKTTRSRQIKEYFEGQGQSVEVINEEALGLIREDCFQDDFHEKNMRAAIKDAVERTLTPDNLVICDSLNYIKGYRYELYCFVREMQQTHCVVWCDTDKELAAEWCAAREDDTYSMELFEDVWGRFETPNERRRWDKPLFTVFPDDESPPLEQMHAHLLNESTKLKANAATHKVRVADADFVHVLDKATQELVVELLEAQQSGVPGSALFLANAQMTVTLAREVGAAELRRLRRQYLNMSQMNPPNIDDVAESFLQYVEASTSL